MSICGVMVDFETSCCSPQVVVDPLIRVVYALHVVVLVMGGENDDFLGIVCHSSGPGMIVRCRDFLGSRLFGPSVW